MKLSVIMPVYNAEGFLRETLDSVLSQSVDGGMEVIAVNDGSTDGSLGILEEYAARDARLKVLSQPNGRQGKARNNGLDHACGQSVAYMDSDDLLSDGFYGKLINAAESRDADIAFAEIKRINGAGIKYFYGLSESICVESIEDKLRICHCPPSFCSVNMVVRRSLIDSLGLRFAEGVFYEDAAYVFRLLCGSGRLVTVPDAQYIYIHHTGSTVHSHQTAAKQLDKYHAHKDVARLARQYGVQLPRKFLNMTKRHYGIGPVCLLKVREREGVETFYLFDFIPVWRCKASDQAE